jgi:hypothetical protein
MNYKIMKVFDCQFNPGMPDDVKKVFFENCEKSNDCYVSWQIADSEYDDSEHSRQLKLIDDWLIENGAVGPKDTNSCGETVLIKHWW